MKETGPHYSQKFVSSDNTRQNISQKLKQYSKIGQDFKNITSNVDSYCQGLILKRILGIRLRLHPHLIYVVRQLVRQLLYQVCYAIYQVSFYLWGCRPKQNY